MKTEQRTESILPCGEKEQCCGCFACYEICPVKAIAMQEDTEGFFYPEINDKVCIHCNLCRKVCPSRSNAGKFFVSEEAGK